MCVGSLTIGLRAFMYAGLGLQFLLVLWQSSRLMSRAHRGRACRGTLSVSFWALLCEGWLRMTLTKVDLCWLGRSPGQKKVIFAWAGWKSDWNVCSSISRQGCYKAGLDVGLLGRRQSQLNVGKSSQVSWSSHHCNGDLENLSYRKWTSVTTDMSNSSSLLSIWHCFWSCLNGEEIFGWPSQMTWCQCILTWFFLQSKSPKDCHRK